MTYCVGIRTHQGLVLASDSRTNSGIDQVEVCRKMHNFVIPGERMFTILSSGSLSLTQSVMTRLEQEFRAGDGLASAANFYDAVRCVGQQVRAVGALDREFMERDKISFSVNLLIGGQIRGESPQLYLIYAQGNPLRCTRLSPFLQIGESKYGRPILDRGIRFGETTLEQAVTYAIISLDSTMRSNVAVGPPIDLLVYANDDLAVKRYRRLDASDPELGDIRSSWEQALRHAIKTVPQIHFPASPPPEQLGVAFTRSAGASGGNTG
jgi:putative proteasome-type protease